MNASTAPDPDASSAPRRRPVVTGRSIPAIGIAVRRRCSRAACGDPATATLVFSYDEQVARLVELADEAEPQTYDLCGRHADRTSPPRGWELADTRPPTEDRPRRLDDEDTVAIIAAALRGDDSPRRVDVIEGGEDTGATPRRVTSTTAVPEDAGATATVADADDVGDPLRAALEELQRVVPADVVDDAATQDPVPLARRRGRELPPPPSTPPPGAPPAGRERQERPRLW